MAAHRRRGRAVPARCGPREGAQAQSLKIVRGDRLFEPRHPHPPRVRQSGGFLPFVTMAILDEPEIPLAEAVPRGTRQEITAIGGPLLRFR